MAQFKHLGMDVVLLGAVGLGRPRAVALCDLARKRVLYIVVLPAAQRGTLVADSVVGLYAAGGTVV